MPYSIGLDFGTESGRVLLLELSSGKEVSVAVIPYGNGVIEDVLPGTDVTLPTGWALQDPDDYVQVILQGIPAVLKESGISGDQVVGIGVDFTSCTVMPVLDDGTPMCQLPEWRTRPHAWPKLWKHHAAHVQSERMSDAAIARRESFLNRYGGRISPEWYFPKLLQVFEEDRELYESSAAFVEGADWVVWYLTGRLVRSGCNAGFKAMWSERTGLPSREFFRSVNAEFLDPAEKLGTVFYPLGAIAGTLRGDLASKLGLSPDVSVAVGVIDAHAAVPAVGVVEPGSLVMVMGTSLCHLNVTETEIPIPGVTGIVKDGVLPGWYGYESGQAALGDMFAWFIRNAVPARYKEEAARRGISLYAHLESLGGQLGPGASGLLALDWWNGNRSILGDSRLSGMVIGFTLQTKPEELYRALLESAAYGTRRIIQNFADHGVQFHTLVACGGIPSKNPLLMQIYADVIGLPVVVHDSGGIPARGAALYGAVAAGARRGGFDSVADAAIALSPPVARVFRPDARYRAEYDRLFTLYRRLHDYFGMAEAKIMHELKSVGAAHNHPER
ncbi:MAG: ribulokinase [Alicyclobacillus sp.]|nr:ribulokinase [Alicyclobacillus sp.]